MTDFRYILISLLTITLLNISCERLAEKNSVMLDDSLRSKREKLFAGKPDVPKDSFEITSAGMGGLILGDSLERICKYYDCGSAVTVNLLEDGKEWPARKIIFRNKKFILAEMINTVNLISKLTTNNPQFKTRNGIHAGLPMDSLVLLSDSIQADAQHKAFMYGRNGIWFRIDEKTTNAFFRHKEPGVSQLKGGKIEEVFIICGDC